MILWYCAQVTSRRRYISIPVSRGGKCYKNSECESRGGEVNIFYLSIEFWKQAFWSLLITLLWTLPCHSKKKNLWSRDLRCWNCTQMPYIFHRSLTFLASLVLYCCHLTLPPFGNVLFLSSCRLYKYLLVQRVELNVWKKCEIQYLGGFQPYVPSALPFLPSLHCNAKWAKEACKCTSGPLHRALTQ